MHVSHLSLVDFRSWPALELPLEPGVTALVGANGQGKTNLVEAVGYVASLSSHRVAADQPLVRAGAERAVVRARVERDGRSTLVEVELNPGKANRGRINRSPVPRAREVLGALRTVLFAPEDLALVRGEPAERRRFLDDLLVAAAPRYAGVRADYERVLKQRNALLKTAFLARRAGRGRGPRSTQGSGSARGPGEDGAGEDSGGGSAAGAGGAGVGSGSGSGDMRTLDVWDAHLSRTGAELLAARLGLVEALRPQVERAYREVSDAQGEAGLVYRSSLGEALDVGAPESRDREVLAAALLSGLASVRSAELERGTSLVGPHRDDLALSLGALPVKGYASHGEGWSFALALRLASYALLRADSSQGDGEPVLVLDDVFAELDTGRRQRLAELVGGAEQLLVTAAVPDDVPEALTGARYDVHAGAVTRVR